MQVLLNHPKARASQVYTGWDNPFIAWNLGFSNSRHLPAALVEGLKEVTPYPAKFEVAVGIHCAREQAGGTVNILQIISQLQSKQSRGALFQMFNSDLLAWITFPKLQSTELRVPSTRTSRGQMVLQLFYTNETSKPVPTCASPCNVRHRDLIFAHGLCSTPLPSCIPGGVVSPVGAELQESFSV